MRAFDLLAKAEQDIRSAAHPRYHFEMALLRWMHLRKLVPLADLMEQLGGGAASASPSSVPARAAGAAPVRAAAGAPARAGAAATAREAVSAPSRTANAASTRAAGVAPTSESGNLSAREARVAPTREATPAPANTATLKDAFLAEVRGAKAFFYNTVVAQAQKIEVADERVTFTFLPTHRALREQFEQARTWLEPLAERIAGRRIAVIGVQADAGAAPAAAASEPPAKSGQPADKRDLKSEAMASPAVQAVLDVFPAEIRDVEEM